jgi:hypothetical protein
MATKKAAKKANKKTPAKKSPDKDKSKGGRPPFEVNQKIIDKVEKLAAQGLHQYQIADVLGICYQTLNEKKKEFSGFSDAIRIGKAKGGATVTNAIFNKACGGDMVAAKYYMNNTDPDNWKERKDVGGTIVHKYEDMDDEELDEELARLEDESD